MGTLALIVQYQAGDPELVQTFTDEREIEVLESAFSLQQGDPLTRVLQFRAQQNREEEEFGNYIEDLLSQPFVRPEIQSHGLQWLRSKLRIEEHKKVEMNAARVIAEYAYKVFQEDPNKTDFLLAGPYAEVRIRIFVINPGYARAA
jgi:hypothetical protein